MGHVLVAGAAGVELLMRLLVIHAKMASRKTNTGIRGGALGRDTRARCGAANCFVARVRSGVGRGARSRGPR